MQCFHRLRHESEHELDQPAELWTSFTFFIGALFLLQTERTRSRHECPARIYGQRAHGISMERQGALCQWQYDRGDCKSTGNPVFFNLSDYGSAQHAMAKRSRCVQDATSELHADRNAMGWRRRTARREPIAR